MIQVGGGCDTVVLALSKIHIKSNIKWPFERNLVLLFAYYANNFE